jgi:hypothetical protein
MLDAVCRCTRDSVVVISEISAPPRNTRNFRGNEQPTKSEALLGRLNNIGKTQCDRLMLLSLILQNGHSFPSNPLAKITSDRPATIERGPKYGDAEPGQLLIDRTKPGNRTVEHL